MKTSKACAAALTMAFAVTAGAPSLAAAYTRTIMGYAAQPVLVPDAALTHDHASGIQGSDPGDYHQVLYPVALDQISGAFSAKVAVTVPASIGGSVVCWAIAYEANGNYAAVTSAATMSDGFQELSLAPVTVPANGYGSVSCWLKAGRDTRPLTHVPPPVPARIHRVTIQQ